MGCAVLLSHRFGGQDLRGFLLVSYGTKKTERFFSPDGSRWRVRTMPGIWDCD
jgi:CO dehydrogenase/acetyl-CoA synthase beta subunit